MKDWCVMVMLRDNNHRSGQLMHDHLTEQEATEKACAMNKTTDHDATTLIFGANRRDYAKKYNKEMT